MTKKRSALENLQDPKPTAASISTIFLQIPLWNLYKGSRIIRGDQQVVPPNSCYILGDNRNQSYDQHYCGFVPPDLIVRKAVFCF